MNSTSKYIVVISVLLQNMAIAKEEVSLDAHIHGRSDLTVALEGEQLEIELSSPAINLLGFEHTLTSEQDLNAIKNIKSMLRKPSDLFSFTDGGCTLTKQSIDVSGLIPTHQDKGHQHVNKESNHHEVIAKYSFHCKKSSTLSAITVKVLNLFSGIHEIRARWITAAKQGSVIVNPDNQVINLR